MSEILNLINSLGEGRDIPVYIALAWIIMNLNILKARAKEDREAAQNRSKEDREAAQKESAKNQAEHAELRAKIHEIKADFKVLLDRSNRLGPDDSAD